MSKSQGQLLSHALRANAVFSALSGTVLLIGAAPLAPHLGRLPPWSLAVIGAGLLAFAAVVWLTAARPRPARALGVSVLDLAWVAGTVPLALATELFTPAGSTTVLVVAAVVGLLAAAQLLGIRELLRDRDGGRGRFRHCIRVRVPDVPADAMWQLVAELGDIARFSPTLSSSSLRGGVEPDIGAVRVCSNTQGQRWAERCVAFDPDGRSLELRFLTEEPGFPYPASVMFGGWTVLEEGSGCVVEVWWSLTPTMPAGWLTVTLMSLQVDSQFAELVSRMAEVAKGHELPETPPRLRAALC